MRRLILGLTLVCLVASPAAMLALDHKNLDEGRPLRLEDAYSLSHGEIAVEVGVAGVFARRGPNRAVGTMAVLYGALPNLHVSLGTQLSTDPHAIDEQTKSGDLHLGALYNLNQESLSVPAFGVKAGLNLPTGVDSAGVDVELGGLVTKSFGNVSLHFNAAYAFLTGTERGERDGRYELVLGASYPIGVPKHTRTTLLTDVFTEQSRARGEENTIGAEIGVRHQLTQRLVFDAGVGTEFAGPADRAPFFVTIGFSFGF